MGLEGESGGEHGGHASVEQSDVEMMGMELERAEEEEEEGEVEDGVEDL